MLLVNSLLTFILSIGIFFLSPEHSEADTPVSCCSIQYTGEVSEELNGRYKFYWNQFYSQDTTLLTQEPDTVVSIPDIWNGLVINGKELGSFGYATYAVTIQSSDHYKNVGFSLSGFYSAYRLYLNGELIAKNGIVGTSPAR